MTVIRGREIFMSEHFLARVRKRFSKKKDDGFAERFGLSVATEILTGGTKTMVSKSAPDRFGRCKYRLTCPETRESITTVALVGPKSVVLVTTYKNPPTPRSGVRKATVADYLRIFGKAPDHMLSDIEKGEIA